ncbi:MAG: 50S ribosomal protein L24e [Candidatus Micrarchaeales archaeon]
MAKCAYCLTELKKGTGIMYIHKTGDIAYYCSNSCFKNHVFLDRKINKKLVVKEVKVTKKIAEKK